MENTTQKDAPIKTEANNNLKLYKAREPELFCISPFCIAALL